MSFLSNINTSILIFSFKFPTSLTANLPKSLLLNIDELLPLDPKRAPEPFTSKYLPFQSKSPLPSYIFRSFINAANAISPLPTPLPPSEPPNPISSSILFFEIPVAANLFIKLPSFFRLA